MITSYRDRKKDAKYICTSPGADIWVSNVGTAVANTRYSRWYSRGLVNHADGEFIII